jgi:GxxExxY protein
LGFGFLECVYEQAMAIALAEAGLDVKRQIAIPVWFRGQQIGDFKADMLVQGNVLLELKVVRTIDLAFEKQLLNYLRATEIEFGLLLNFGHKPEFRRLVFENTRKRSAFIRGEKLLTPQMNADRRRSNPNLGRHGTD